MAAVPGSTDPQSDGRCLDGYANRIFEKGGSQIEFDDNLRTPPKHAERTPLRRESPARLGGARLQPGLSIRISGLNGSRPSLVATSRVTCELGHHGADRFAAPHYRISSDSTACTRPKGPSPETVSPQIGPAARASRGPSPTHRRGPVKIERDIAAAIVIVSMRPSKAFLVAAVHRCPSPAHCRVNPDCYGSPGGRSTARVQRSRTAAPHARRGVVQYRVYHRWRWGRRRRLVERVEQRRAMSSSV